MFRGALGTVGSVVVDLQCGVVRGKMAVLMFYGIGGSVHFYCLVSCGLQLGGPRLGMSDVNVSWL